MLKFSTARQEQKLLLTPAAQMFVLTDANYQQFTSSEELTSFKRK